MRKTIMIHVDGFYGHPCEALGNSTPLRTAQTPHLDYMASHGEHGRLGVPGETRGFSGELALLTLLGYDSRKWYTGPGPFEAVSLEVVLDKHDVAYLCHLVTIGSQDDEWGDGKKLGSQLIMNDASAGGVETEEARELVDAINDYLVSENIQLYFGHHHRHLMVWVGGGSKVVCANPQEAIGQSLKSYLPSGEGHEVLWQLMEASRGILSQHSVNEERLEVGKKPINCIWLWGAGKAVELSNFCERWKVKGSVLSQDGPYVGVGMSVGLRTVAVPDEGKGEVTWLKTMAQTALGVLEKEDLVCVHIPASFSAFNQDRLATPMDMVEHLQNIDQHLIELVRTSMVSKDSYRIIVVCTPHWHESESEIKPIAPYLVYEGQQENTEGASVSFDEEGMANRPVRDARHLFERVASKL